MARPYWSGQIRISLVSFTVNLFPATEARSEIHFHQLSRSTGERIRHQKVSGEEGPVDNSDIVKGYEYSKGEYITIEPGEIDNLRIPSRHSLDVVQFVDTADLKPEIFEKPYFVVPGGKNQSEAFAVVRKALQATRKAALGKIAFGGREHLVAIVPTPGDKLPGMMAYTLRYAEELRDPAEYFAEIPKATIDADQLALARQLIERKSSPFALDKFKDEYEAALREMVEAKISHTPLPQDEPAPKSAKVVNLMDALRRSVQRDTAPPVVKKSAPAKKGLTLVNATPPKPSKSRRKMA